MLTDDHDFLRVNSVLSAAFRKPEGYTEGAIRAVTPVWCFTRRLEGISFSRDVRCVGCTSWGLQLFDWLVGAFGGWCVGIRSSQ